MSAPKPSKKYIVLEPLILAVCIIIGIVIGYKINDTENDFSLISRLDNGATPIGRVEEVLRFVENKYVDSIDSDFIEDKLINSILSELDPHSIYIPPSELADINRQMSGKYLGIGIESIQIGDTFYISRILEDSPAEENDFEIGDQILSVNDTLVSGNDFSYSRLSEAIVEKETLQIILKNANGERTIEMVPRELKVNSARSHFKIREGLGYIRLERFTSKSYSDFMQAVETLITDNHLENLIIDLRNNPGGYLPEANKILSQLFKEKDRLLLYTEGDHSEKIEYKTSGKAFFNIENIAVLIDEGSASGSEILAGAIQDWDRGVIIGSQSYGKGLVQEQYDLTNGGAIRLTVAKYFTPSGRLIQKPYGDSANQFEDYYENRITGNHFENATANDSAGIYRTLLLNRNVESGGGIKPDISIESNQTEFNEAYYDALSDMRAALFLEFINGKWNLSKEDFPLEEEKIEQVLFTLNQKTEGNASTILRFKEPIITEANYYLAKLNHGEVYANSVEAKFDNVILEAIKALKNETLLAEFVN